MPDRDLKQPPLKRVLGRWDLVLLFVVAIFNLNVVPSIAANGGVTVWLWMIAVGWIIVPFALLLSISIAGIGSAWMGGSARIPFVAGLDSYMPAAMGKVHARYATPHVALIVQGLVSLILIVFNFTLSGGVQEAFQKMLSAAVVLQLIPFMYVFAALVKFAWRGAGEGGRYGRGTLMFAGLAGLLTTTIAIIVAFFPAKQITSLWTYEITMFAITFGLIAIAMFFFYVYGRLRAPRTPQVEAETAGST